MNELETIRVMHESIPAICYTCRAPITYCAKLRAKGECPLYREEKAK